MAVDKTFKPKKGVNIPEGTQVGLFLGLVHLGIQRGEYNGEVSYKDQVLLKFELPEIQMDDGRPVTISKRETHTLGKKGNLLKLVKALRGGKDIGDDGIDFEDLIGSPVLLELKENIKKTGVNIVGYMPLPEVLRKTLKPLMNEPQLLLDVENISDKELKAMPEWMQKVINERVKEDNDVDPEVNY